MNREYQKIEQAYESIRSRIPFCPLMALVLGSGLGDFAEDVTIEESIEYESIEGFPTSTVPGHRGRFVFAHIQGVPVVMMQGRVHYYEGYRMQDVVLPVRLMHRMGAQILFLTNAAGGIQDGIEAGDFMLITDHISCFVPNPLIGNNIEELGTRFPDMSEIYDKQLQAVIRHSACTCQIPLREGIYVQLTGPSFESPAEIKMLHALGAGAVGMSTVCEAIAARHMGMRVCGISCISNLACGIGEHPLSHQEVQESADRVAPLFKQLVMHAVSSMGEQEV